MRFWGDYQQPVQCDMGAIRAAEAWGATTAALASTASVMASVAIARLIMVFIPYKARRPGPPPSVTGYRPRLRGGHHPTSPIEGQTPAVVDNVAV